MNNNNNNNEIVDWKHEFASASASVGGCPCCQGGDVGPVGCVDITNPDYARGKLTLPQLAALEGRLTSMASWLSILKTSVLLVSTIIGLS